MLTALMLMAQYCGEMPVHDVSLQSVSYGGVTNGAILGAVLAPVRVLPLRHRERCLGWTTPRLARALADAGAIVGNLSRAAGGPILYSRSHQSGRDADIAFFQTDKLGVPSEPLDLTPFNADLHNADAVFDVARNWQLVKALLTHPDIEVEWLFIAEPLRYALLTQAAADPLAARAAVVLHQPSDAPPHDDHLHLRIHCTHEERARGCH